MRSSAPDILPIFRSRLQGELLAAVLVHTEERSISDLARRLGAPTPTVQREVARLARAGILSSRRVGQTRLISANRSSPIYESLAQLLLRTFGPTAVLARELGDVAGVDSVEIFGSWAARYLGEPGASPGDIDVLVIGAPDRDELFESAQRAEQTLGREVNTVVVSPARWFDASEPFLRGIRERPRITVLDKGVRNELGPGS